ncbi:ABC transporter ATP-binding protein [Actinospica robiniae]|uniref:ABC transporter ATP-binding protein n=1 Tax=Actinospica robiniae TaxID=304901 RepID=UPI000409F2C3|nr:ABC transporter ATP-binding protein [Actinospica robiniae]
MSAEIRLEQVRKTFALGRDQSITAVGGIDLRLAPGSLTALTGPSGSGKSTLLHVIGSIERADEGSAVVVDGLELTRASRRELTAYRRTVGFVFQRFHLLPALTALENVMAPVIPERNPGFDKRERAASLLGSVGLAGREQSLPSRMSGGQQQRVAIARALINRPKLLLADEPTGNLDSRTGAAILELLLRLREQHAVTVVLSTHDRVVAERCDTVVELIDGRLTGQEVAV